MIGTAPGGTRTLIFDGNTVPVAPDGKFLIAFDRDAGPNAQLVATLHMLTSVESFIELRRNAGLSLKATREALTAAVLGLVPG